MRIAVLIKQVPGAEMLELLPTGRIRREGVDLEMNAYCRRAVAKGVELAAATGGSCLALTLGPPSAEEVLREAVAWGADEDVLVTDPAFAGSDTLATASVLAAALRHLGGFDLVLAGRNSVDADTGQVGPELAELLDLPFIAAARELDVTGATAVALCELDDASRTVRVVLPAVVSVAERLCQPAKVPAEQRGVVAAERLRRLPAAALGAGPWGGLLPLRAPRAGGRLARCTVLGASARHRVSVLSENREDHVDDLLAAKHVIAVGAGITHDEYAQLEPLLQVTGGELAATRKVTDRGWLPRARQVGLTGHSLAPDLYLALGAC